MTRERPAARFLRAGEMLAIDPGAVRTGPQGMFWMFGPQVAPNERRGSVAIVHVRGPLDHHADAFDDNYESILQRLADATTGADVLAAHADKQARHEYMHGYEPDYAPLADIGVEPPSSVLMMIDSPGGAVSGLNECVFAIQRLRTSSGVPIHAYVNELCASAAFALACGCEKVYAPPSAIIGSIGVISTMASQARADEKDGIDVRLITSGARKADGHPHAPISDEAVSAEQGRVDKLARSFFRIASKARGIPLAKVEGFQAGIFLGDDAERRGLVDEVVSLDDALLALQPGADDGTPARGTLRAASKPLDTTAQSGTRLTHADSAPRHAGETMLKIRALIKRTQVALAAEKDPAKIVALTADLVAFKKTEKTIEHTKSEEGADEPPPSSRPDLDDDDDEGEDEKKAAADKAAADKAAADAAAAEGDADEKASATAALRMLEAATGRKGSAAIGAAMGRFVTADRVQADVKQLKADANRAERAALTARAARYLPPHLLASTVGAMKLDGLKAFVEEAEKGEPMVMTEEGDMLKPRASAPGTEASLSKDVLAGIDAAVAACGLRDPKAHRKMLIDAHLKAHADALVKSPKPGQGGY